MIAALRKILRRRAVSQALIFRHDTGRNSYRADGERLWRKLAADQRLTDPETLIALKKEDPAALERYFDIVAEIFGVSRYDPQTEAGYTDGELAELMAAFTSWVEQKKKRARS